MGSNNRLFGDRLELKNCYFVKTILMLLVVGYHSMVFWSGDWFTVISPANQSDILVWLSKWLNSFHIYGFTLCSGYLFSYLIYENGSYTNYLDFVKGKARRLLIPYLFSCMIWVLPFAQYYNKFDMATVCNRYFLATNPNQLWFLWMLFDVFVLIWPLVKFLQRDILSILLGAVSLGIGVVGEMLFPNIFCIWTAFTYIPFFIIGMKIRQKRDWFVRRIPIYMYIIIDCTLFVMWLYIANKSSSIMKILNFGIAFVLHVVGAVMIFFVLQKLAMVFEKWSTSKLFEFVSKRSMSVYLFHQQVIYVTICIFNGKLSPYIHAGINFAISLLVSLIVSSLLLRFKATRFLIGEK